MARLRSPEVEWPTTFDRRIAAPVGSGWNPWSDPDRSKWNRAPPLGRAGAKPRIAASDVDERIAFTHRIGDAPAAFRCRQVQPVRHGPAPIGSVGHGVDPFDPTADPHQAADVADIAVRVPTGRREDRERLPEVAVAVDQRHGHQRVVRDDVDVAAVPVIPVPLHDPIPRHAPVRLADTPVADVVDQPADDRVRRDLSDADIEETIQIVLDERLRLHRGEDLSGMDRRRRRD